MSDAVADAFPAGYERCEFEHGGLTRDVYCSPRIGPAVILIHEAGGLNMRTMDVAERLTQVGLSVVLPVLIDRPRRSTSVLQLGRNMVGICTAAEFAAFAKGGSTPIANWLRALARREQRLAGGPGGGVIGMCFSGGFALATVTEPAVAAAVASQPALPFPLPGRRTALGLSPRELDIVTSAADKGFCIRSLRYQRDYKSPGARMRFIEEIFPNASVVEIRTWNPRKHSVLVDGARADPGSDLGRALTGTIDYLLRSLTPRRGADPANPAD